MDAAAIATLNTNAPKIAPKSISRFITIILSVVFI